MKPKRKSKRSTLFITLFGVPFLAVGCVMAFLAFRMIGLHLAAQKWVEVPATILKLNLETNSGSESTTYRVACTYSYTYDGRSYQSERVGLVNMSDNIGSWHRDTYNRLKAAQQPPRRAGGRLTAEAPLSPPGQSRSVPCYVNPSEPTEALLDRDLRFGLLAFYLVFVTAFGGVGAGFVAGGTLSLLKSGQPKQPPQKADAGDDRPWLSDERWASGIIRPSARTRAGWAVAIALFWNAIWLPLALLVPHEVAKGNSLALLGLLPGLIGLLIAGWAIRAVLQYRRFGRSWFECDPLPGVIGGRLRGRLVLAGDIAGLDRIDVSLQCRRTFTERRGGDSTTRTETLWEAGDTLNAPPVRFGEQEMRLPVDFVIPNSCRPTDDSADDRIEWKLLAQAPVEGVDLALEFEVPIFRTEASDAAIDEDDAQAREEPAVADAEPPATARVCREENARGDLVLIASAWPGLYMASFLLGFCVLFSSVAGLTGYGFFRGNWFLVIFLVIFGLLALLMWAILLSFIGSHRVTVSPGRIEVRRSYGLFSRRRTLAAEGIELSFKDCASAGRRKWYAVFAKPPGGRKVQLAAMIEGKTAAQWFIGQIENALAGQHRASTVKWFDAEKPLY